MSELAFTEYRDSDFPFTLFFNGESMPKWSNIWPSVVLEDQYFDQRVMEICFRIDNEGMLYSEDASLFIVAAQETLSWVIKNQDQFRENIESRPGGAGFDLEGWLSALFRMIEIAEHQSVVFWTSGYAADQKAILELMRRHKLGPEHPDYLEAPHVVERRKQCDSLIEKQRKSLRREIRTTSVSKKLRSSIHALPKRA